MDNAPNVFHKPTRRTSLLSPDPPRSEADDDQVLESRALVVRLPCAVACVRPALLPCAPLRLVTAYVALPLLGASV
jgi:hypothetical protein